MSIISSLRRIDRRSLCVVAVLAALFGNYACNSTGAPTAQSGVGGANVGKGGAGNVGGQATGRGGMAMDSNLDQWEPPEVSEQDCSIAADTAKPEDTKSLSSIGCYSDFEVLASVPVSSVVPGALSVKVVLDTSDNDTLYFQNSKLYPTHWDFTNANVSTAQGKAFVPPLLEFNQTMYSAADRRFILAAVTYYTGPNYWALEFSPYDTATSEMIEKLFRAIKAKAYFGDALLVHATSDSVGAEAAKLPDDIHVKITDQIYAGVDYQPLTMGETYGKLNFVNASELSKAYVGFKDIVVLDAVPNDISVTAGIITEQFQTPLSHINVLSNARQTPNMGLRGATTNETLRALSGKWVHFKVGPEEWTAEEVDEAAANAWWADHMPEKVVLPEANLSVTELTDIVDVTDVEADSLRDALSDATLAFGAKSANYSVLANMPEIPIKKAFGIPLYYYFQFMKENGFDEQVKAMLADPEFQNSLAVQDVRLAQLRSAMINGEVNESFQKLLKNKLNAEYPGKKMRFRTSTNAEDLNGFPCAGCYDSHSGDPEKWKSDLLLAIKQTWSGVWFYRTFREREYHSIDHLTVGMGLLVHTNFQEEEANGVAVTQNILDSSGVDLDALYINVQKGGDVEVVASEAGVTSDQFLYYLSTDTKKVVTHSSLVAEGESVLTASQEHKLAVALNAIHTRFQSAYGNLAGNMGWYAMDVEFKFDNEADPTQPATLFIKQARPYPDPRKVGK